MGHVRLSIQDLSSAGHQPMYSACKKFAIIFKSEIYKHLDLRKKLTDIDFKGHSDTETIVNYFAKYGISSVKDFNGIFAFALVDIENKKIYIARDRYGVKPLYFYHKEKEFVFASEIRPIKKLIKVNIDKDNLATLLKLRYNPSPLTLYKEIQKLKPGHILEYNLDSNTYYIYSFIDPVFIDKNISFENALEKYGKLFEQAIKRQLLSDVEVGVLLSGGIDSALVAFFELYNIKCNNYFKVELMIVINARFLTQKITGVQRFAIEISKQIKYLLKDKIIFVSPKNIIHKDLAKDLDAKTIGNQTEHLWEQIDLPLYLKKMNSPLLVCLANTAPLFYTNKIITVHDVAFERFPHAFNWKFRYFYKFLIPRIIKTSKKIITVSNFSKREIINLYKVKPDDIEVIYNAISENFKPKKTLIKDNYILAVSSFDPRKNLHSLIKAFKSLKIKNIKLYLIGDTNKIFSKTYLEYKIKDNNRIILKGRVNDDELIKLYSNAICFVYPSLYEGFGIPPLEAQACGCPIIVSNIPSLKEVCRDTALYCNPYDVQDIKNKIELLINNKNLQKELIKKGLENSKRFRWEKSAKRIIEIIKDLA